MAKFKPLVTDKSPFSTTPDVNKPSRFRPNPPNATVTWLKPELVCEVSYTEVTSDGVMRHPSFEGMREDKKPKDVMREKPVKTEEAVKAANGKRQSANGKDKRYHATHQTRLVQRTKNFTQSHRKNTGKNHQRPRAEIQQPQQDLLAKRKIHQARPAELLLPGGALHLALPQRTAPITQPLPEWD